MRVTDVMLVSKLGVKCEEVEVFSGIIGKEGPWTVCTVYHAPKRWIWYYTFSVVLVLWSG